VVGGCNKPSPRTLLPVRLNRLSVFDGSALMLGNSPVVDFKATGARDTKPSRNATVRGLGALTWWLAGA
jgi:hypothetical protein